MSVFPKVLHVDDDYEFLEIFKLNFQHELNIVSIGDPRQVMALLKEEKFDVVITDYDMPQLNGLEILKKIKGEFPEIPVIFHTGQGNEQIARKAFLSGASDYFTKDMLSFAYKEKILNSIWRSVEKRKIEEQAKEKEKFITAVAESVPGILYVYDFTKNKILFINRSISLLLGYNPGEIDEERFLSESTLLHPHDLPVVREHEERVCHAKDTEVLITQYRLRRKDGEYLWFKSRERVFKRNHRGEAVQVIGVIHDITDLRKSQDRVFQLNRIYEVTSQINQMIVRVRDSETILKEACGLAVKYGKFPFTWVGLINEEKSILEPFTYYGDNGDFLFRFPFSLKDHNLQDSSFIRSVVSGNAVVFQDLLSIRRDSPSRQLGLEKGYRASASFPIKVNGKVVGNFNLLSREPHFFDDDEIRLLNEVVGDISFALESLEKENKLKESNLMRDILYSALHNTPLGMFMGRIEEDKYIILEWNNSAEKIFEWKREEALGRDFMELLEEEKDKEVVAELIRYFSTQTNPVNLRHKCKSRYGREKILNWFTTPLRDEENNVTYVMALAEDVTEYVALNESLKTSEERFRLVTEATHDAIWDWNLITDQVYFSPRWKAMLGYSQEELPDCYQTWENLLHPHERERVVQEVMKSLDPRNPSFSLEFRMRCKDGGYIWILDRGQTRFDQEGKPVRMVGNHTDITARKQMEEALENSRKKLQTERNKLLHIMEALEDGVYVVNQNYDIEYVNSAIKREFGEVKGRKCYEYFHRRRDTCPWCKNHQVLAGKSVRWDWYSPSNGKFYELLDTPIVNDDGSICKLEIFKDVTGEKIIREELEKALIEINNIKKSQEELKAHTDYLHSIINTISDPVFVKNQEHTWILLNDAFCKFMGYEREELIGKSDFDFFPKEEARVFWEKDEMVFETGKENINEENFTDARGNLHIIVTKKSLYKDRRGNKILVGVIRDITERKKLEESLNKKIWDLTHCLEDKEEIQFRDLFEMEDIQHIQDIFSDATGVASIITEIDGTPITRPSNFCRLCMDVIRKTPIGRENCFKSDAVIGRRNPSGPIVQRCLSGSLWDAGASITVGDRHLANWLIGQVIDEDPDPDRMLLYARHIGADEDEFMKALQEVKRMPRQQFEKVAQALFLIANQMSLLALRNIQQERNITRLKKAEEEILRKNKQLDDFAYTVAHDLKNPVNMIRGILPFLKSEPSLQERNIKSITEHTDFMLKFIDNLLQLSRAGKVIGEMQRFSPGSLIRVIFNSMQKGDKTLRISMPRPLPEIYGDPVSMMQVFTNLLQNAVYYRDPDKEELIVEVESRQEGDAVVLSFKNNGIGISADNLKNIFNPGFTLRKDKGTGFGLAISQKIMEAHRGSIWAESPGLKQGSTFFIKIRG